MTQLRRAQSADTDAVVDVFQSARADGLPYLTIVHSGAEDRAYFAGLVSSGAVTVAVEGERIAGFIVLGDARVEHLYVAPEAQRRRVGSRLLRHAQDLCPDGLDLWVFQRNHAAIAFYEAHGFTVAELTEGTGNEEREPDARMVWRGA